MNFSNGVTVLLTLLWISLFDGATASLNCSFSSGLCDWKQTAKQCSWRFSPTCVNKTANLPCLYIPANGYISNSGSDCSTVGLKATIGNRRARGVYFEYKMANPGVNLQVKDSHGKTLWSCSQSMGPNYYPVLLQINGYGKAVTIEAHLAPNSRGIVGVRSVREVENIKDVASSTPTPADSPAVDMPTSLTANMPTSQSVKMPTSHAVKMPTSHAAKMPSSAAADKPTSPTAKIHIPTLSTMQDFPVVTTTSSSLKTTSSPIVKTRSQTVKATTKATKTTSRPEKNTSSHVTTEWNHFTKSHQTTTTTSVKDNSISSKEPKFENPVPAKPKIFTPSIAVLLVGMICSTFLLIFLAIFTVRQIRRRSSSEQLNPELET